MATLLDTQPVSDQANNFAYIPKNIVDQDLMSQTNSAYQCFTKQVFSARLQAYLISYVISTSSEYSIYK